MPHYLITHIARVLHQYAGAVPLHHFLRQYYRDQPKLGSRDRRAISDAVYSWYRCSRAFESADISSPESLLPATLLLCGLAPKGLLFLFPDDWADAAAMPLPARIAFLESAGFEVRLPQIFPADIPFSAGITFGEWAQSILRQPALFIRRRKDVHQITELLANKNISFEIQAGNCIRLPNGSAIDKLLPPEIYVVQDASSQITGNYFIAKPGEEWWDCCAGAGGKSLLLKDSEPGVHLLVSDVRESILHNLSERFRVYHLAQPQMLCVDVANNAETTKKLAGRRFDAILCDAPCTGSGTWARTPEQRYFFDQNTLSHYAARQHAILANAVKYLKPGGRILYITCSVFRAENEAVIEAITTEKNLVIGDAALINGTGKAADSMFVAVLQLKI